MQHVELLDCIRHAVMLLVGCLCVHVVVCFSEMSARKCQKFFCVVCVSYCVARELNSCLFGCADDGVYDVLVGLL